MPYPRLPGFGLFANVDWDSQLAPTIDICAGKHGGVPESKAANLRAHHGKHDWHRKILEALRARGAKGATCKELAYIWSVEMHRISGRVTELLAAGKVRKTLTRRDGGRVILPT